MYIILQYVRLRNFFCFQLGDCYIFQVPMYFDSVLGRLRRRWEDDITLDLRKQDGKTWTGLIWFGMWVGDGISEDGKEILGCIYWAEFLRYERNCKLLKEPLFPRCIQSSQYFAQIIISMIQQMRFLYRQTQRKNRSYYQ